ncbi:MAG: peptidoglycan-associated lipoprotein Pal [Alphaproteobacteria bacterium]
MSFKTFAVIALALTIGACTTPKDEATTGGSATVGSSQTKPLKPIPPRQVATTGTTATTYAPGSQEQLSATIGDRVFFDTDRYDLSQEARASVALWADWMKEHQNVALTIGGHADERGTREYNLALAARRANAVRDYLSALGVSRSRVNTVSYGKERPSVLGSSANAWGQNRRAAAIVR